MARITFACFRKYKNYCVCGLDRKDCGIGHVILEPFADLQCVAKFNFGSIFLGDHGEVVACRL